VHDTLILESNKLEVLCDVTGVSSSGGDMLWAATIDLKCMDVKNATHDIYIDLQLFAPLVLALEAGDQALLTYESSDDFGNLREWLSLRGPGDTLALFATRGFQVFTPPQAPLWAPLGLVGVEEELLCATEVLGECETRRRAAIDITVGEVTGRAFDRTSVALPDGLVAHVGAAVVVDYYPNEVCIGDGVDGFETRLIVARGS